MAILVLEVEETLMHRISCAAAERGLDTANVAVEALKQAFVENTGTSGANEVETRAVPTTKSATQRTIGEEIIALLTPFWEEQKAHPERFQGGQPPIQGGDIYEEYLAAHWAEDIRKSSMNR